MTDLEATNKLTELQSYFKKGKYWNHDIEYDVDVMSVRNIQDKHYSHTGSGSCGCNKFGGGLQCHGFALYMASLVFGSYPEVGDKESASNGRTTNGWKVYSKQYLTNIKFAPGDVIRSDDQHSAIIWKVNGDTIEVAEAWGSEGSAINWGNFNGNSTYKSISALRPTLNYIAKAPKTSTVKVTATFDVNGGISNFTSREYIKGSAYGRLPIARHGTYEFIGWWPEKNINSEEYTNMKIVPVGYEHKLYAQWGKKYKITNVANGKCLNIDGNNLTSLDNGRNVNLWSDTGSKEQIWLVPNLKERQVIKSFVDRNFGLNINRLKAPYNCNVHRVFQNETDAVISIILNINYGYYKIKLYNYNLYLTAEISNNENGANVYWSANLDNQPNVEYQRWRFTAV